MNKLYFKKNISLLFLCLLCTYHIKAQERVFSVDFPCDTTNVYFNTLFKEAKMPFLLKTDTIDKNINLINNELYYINENGEYKIDDFSESGSCLGELTKIKNKNTDIYIILICEFLVGYDYYIIIKENPLDFFITETIDFGLYETYHFITETIDFENKTIKVFLKNSKTEKNIKFKYLF